MTFWHWRTSSEVKLRAKKGGGRSFGGGRTFERVRYYCFRWVFFCLFFAEGQSSSLRSQKQDRIIIFSLNLANIGAHAHKNIQSIPGLFFASVQKRKNRPGDEATWRVGWWHQSLWIQMTSFIAIYVLWIQMTSFIVMSRILCLRMRYIIYRTWQCCYSKTVLMLQ